jgi:WD40 repeat protein
LIGDSKGQIKVYNGTSYALIDSFQAHSSRIIRIKQSPFSNRNFVATCSFDSNVKIWTYKSDKSNWNLYVTYTAHTGEVYGLEWINEDIIASTGSDHIKIWSFSGNYFRTRDTIKTGSNVTSLKLFNSSHLAAGVNSRINIYEIDTGRLVATLQGHSNYVRDLILISNSDLLASSSTDFTARIWDLRTYTSDFTLNGHSSSLYGLKQISSDILASGALDYTIRLWNITSGQSIRTLTNHTNEIWYAVDLLNSGDSQRLVSGSLDETIKIWNYTTGECLNTIQTGSPIHSLIIFDLSKLEKIYFKTF